MKSLLEFILIHLVNNPDQVTIDHREEDGLDIYTIHVAPEDVGRVIGKSGKIINAIRSIAKVRAIKENRRILVKLDDEITHTEPQVSQEV